MYTRIPSKNRLGSFEGTLSGVQIADPVTGYGVEITTFSGGGDVESQIKQIALYAQNGVNKANTNDFNGAKNDIATAKRMLMAVNAPQLVQLVQKAEQHVAQKERENTTSAGEVMQTAGSFIGPLAQIGVAWFGAKQEQKLARAQNRGGGGGGGGQQTVYVPAAGPSTGLILGIVGGVAVLLVVMMMMMNKSAPKRKSKKSRKR